MAKNWDAQEWDLREPKKKLIHAQMAWCRKRGIPQDGNVHRKYDEASRKESAKKCAFPHV